MFELVREDKGIYLVRNTENGVEAWLRKAEMEGFVALGVNIKGFVADKYAKVYDEAGRESKPLERSKAWAKVRRGEAVILEREPVMKIKLVGVVDDYETEVIVDRGLILYRVGTKNVWRGREADFVG